MADGTRIDLQISNVTEYNAFNPLQNGLSQKTGGTFGVINMKAPSSDDPALHSFVQLRFSFLDAATQQPVAVAPADAAFTELSYTKGK